MTHRLRYVEESPKQQGCAIVFLNAHPSISTAGAWFFSLRTGMCRAEQPEESISVRFLYDPYSPESVREMEDEYRVDRLIVDYRRAKQNMVDVELEVDGDVDRVALTMCDELISELTREITSNTHKAMLLKVLDNVFYLFTHILSFSVFVIGLYQGASSGDDVWFYITSILSGVGALIMEIGKRYQFKDQSIMVYESVQKYESMSLELRQLRVSAISGYEKISMVRDMEIRVSEVQVHVFR